MTTPGVDYAWARPGGKALQAAGKHFACRYLSHDASKNISRAEADDLAAHGVWTVVVFESTAGRALAGHSAGIADAKTAVAVATAAGMPKGRPIYFAVDFDASASQQTAINLYLDGAASVIGRSAVGVYGGYWVVKRSLDAGKAALAWQTMAWSGGRWDPRAKIRQTGAVKIGGASCDLDDASGTDYGQWQPGKSPTQPAPKPAPTPAPKPAPVPTVDLSHLVAARAKDLPAKTGHKTFPADVLIVERALQAEGLLVQHYCDGSWGSKTDAAYTAFRHKMGYTGAAATGAPGMESLKKLGARHGFRVIA